MQFDITIEASVSDVMTYCFNRIKEEWPEATLVDSSGTTYTRVNVALNVSGKCAIVYSSLDMYITGKMFNCEVPSLQIEVDGGSVRVTPSNPARKVAERLLRLPIWAYKVEESQRLKVI